MIFLSLDYFVSERYSAKPFLGFLFSTIKMPHTFQTLKFTSKTKKKIICSRFPTKKTSAYFVNRMIVQGKNHQTPPLQT